MSGNGSRSDIKDAVDNDTRQSVTDSIRLGDHGRKRLGTSSSQPFARRIIMTMPGTQGEFKTIGHIDRTPCLTCP